MSNKLLNRAFKDNHIKGSQRLALVSLADQANNLGIALVSVKTLMGMMNVSHVTARKCVQVLEADRRLEVYSRKGRVNAVILACLLTPEELQEAQDVVAKELSSTRRTPKHGLSTMTPKPVFTPPLNTGLEDPSTQGLADPLRSLRIDPIKGDGDQNFKAQDVPYEDIIPEHLNTPPFWKTWGKWVHWRKTVKKAKVDPYGAKLQLKLLGKYPPEVAIRIIEKSMSSSWQGLFAPHPNHPDAQYEGRTSMDDTTTDQPELPEIL